VPPGGASHTEPPDKAKGTGPGIVELFIVIARGVSREKDAPPFRLTRRLKVSLVVLAVAVYTGRKISFF
jgi:hypothetical protein